MPLYAGSSELRKLVLQKDMWEITFEYNDGKFMSGRFAVGWLWLCSWSFEVYPRKKNMSSHKGFLGAADEN